MSANYWASSQRHNWLTTREKLAETLSKLEDEDRALVQQYPLPERRLLSIYFNVRKYSSQATALIMTNAMIRDPKTRT
jgi:hypothetical protein